MLSQVARVVAGRATPREHFESQHGVTRSAPQRASGHHVGFPNANILNGTMLMSPILSEPGSASNSVVYSGEIYMKFRVKNP